MNTKTVFDVKYIFATIAVLIVAFFVFEYLYYGENKEIDRVSISSQSINYSEEFIQIDAKYPKINGVNERINQDIYDFVSDQVSTFKQTAKENEEARKATMPKGDQYIPFDYPLNINYDTQEVSDKYISVILAVDLYSGGAHGMRFYKSFNYDSKTGKELTLKNIVGGDRYYLNKISDYVIADITKQIQDKDTSVDVDTQALEDGAGPDEKNFQTFTFDEGLIVFYFEPYQVAPYVYGDFSVAMPRLLFD